MNKTQTLKVKTAPGDNIEIWKWVNGVLVFDCNIPHKRNIGEIMLPVGEYVYYVVSEIGEYKVK